MLALNNKTKFIDQIYCLYLRFLAKNNKRNKLEKAHLPIFYQKILKNEIEKAHLPIFYQKN